MLLLVATVLFSVFVVVKLVVDWISGLNSPFFVLCNLVVFYLLLDLCKSDSKFGVGFGYDDLSKSGGNLYGF